MLRHAGEYSINLLWCCVGADVPARQYEQMAICENYYVPAETCFLRLADLTQTLWPIQLWQPLS